ncbi:hypothetical protein [Gaopeijia maritima]
MTARHPLLRGALRLGRRSALPLAVLLSACATQTVSSTGGGSGMAGTSPLQSVERFLVAVNAHDLDNMAALFGTRDGPFQGNRAEIEIQMDALATILSHQAYEIVSERQVPGRQDPTTRVGVTLTIDGEVYPDVSFVTVRTGQGRWMVQEIDVERLTGG